MTGREPSPRSLSPSPSSVSRSVYWPATPVWAEWPRSCSVPRRLPDRPSSLLLGRRQLGPRSASVVALLGPTLLAALLVTQAFADERRLVLDARAAGLGAGGLAIVAKAPTLVVIAVAALTAALVRAV